MKVRFNFNLQAWIEDVMIEADSYEEAEEKLLKMDVADLINEGYIHNSDLDSIDGDIEERDITVHVYDIKYDLMDSDFEDNGIDPEDEEACERFEKSLPQDLTLEIKDVETDYSSEEMAISDAISDKTGWMVDNFSFDIIKE